MTSTIVQTQSGKLEGVIENGLVVFKGIPYAAPPLGKLRWNLPLPYPSWPGIRPAREYGKISLQASEPVGGLPGFSIGEESSEDCLFLNIWTPGLDGQKRPVMVWIHGGAFVMGSGSLYRSGRLAKTGNLVLVSLNYRLGVLGFLNLRMATGNKIPSGGNEGLFDQIAALRWVKENIAAFGGDPDNVTLCGESAGGMSIACLMAMPAARGLFHKAILQSGVGTSARPSEVTEKIGREFLMKAGWDGANVEQMQKLAPDQLLKIQSALPPVTASGLSAVTPTIDGEILPPVLDALNNDAAKGVITLVGSNLDEWRIFKGVNPIASGLSEDDLVRRLEEMLPPQFIFRLIKAYRNGLTRRGVEVKPADILNAVQSDIMFRLPAVKFIETLRRRGETSFAYLFNWPSPMHEGIYGACHALEVGFVFGEPDAEFCGSRPDADKLADEIMGAWAAFARTGNPSTPQIGKWPPYSEKRETMLLGKISHLEEAPYEEEREVWDWINRE